MTFHEWNWFLGFVVQDYELQFHAHHELARHMITYRCFSTRHVHNLSQFFSGQRFTITFNSDGLSDNFSRCRSMTYHMSCFSCLGDWCSVDFKSSCNNHRVAWLAQIKQNVESFVEGNFTRFIRLCADLKRRYSSIWTCAERGPLLMIQTVFLKNLIVLPWSNILLW